MNEIQEKKTVGFAIASLICACLFLIPILGVFLSMAAIIFGIIALVEISKNRDRLKGNGLAITGIALGATGLILVPILVLLAAIAIPNFLRARHNANEALAQRTLQEYYRMEEDYKQKNLSYVTFEPFEKDGYSYSCSDVSADTYIITAVPIEQGITGSRTFVIDETGVITADDKSIDYTGPR